MSFFEMSHRSKEFDEILATAQRRMHELFGIPDDYQVMFMGGGASLQFAMVPMNFLKGGSADYVNTGAWSKKAAAEAKRFGTVKFAGDTSGDNFNHLPAELKFSDDAKYVYFTSNNTIYGTQYLDFPDVGKVPLVCDMSSDMMSHPWDVSRFSLIFAGAQKNLGPAGVTVMIIKKDFVEQASSDVPTMLSYKTHFDKNSLFNTPPTGAIYCVKLVLDWMAAQGGLDAIAKINAKKAALLYDAIDGSDGYFRGTVIDKAHRSQMNVPYRLPSEDLEKKFIAEATAAGLVGLKGHRSVGGCRASIYNAMPIEGVERLVAFMQKFRSAN
jgi:phosphoserine aminotransferase